jgi:hypothetical protein
MLTAALFVVLAGPLFHGLGLLLINTFIGSKEEWPPRRVVAVHEGEEPPY